MQERNLLAGWRGGGGGGGGVAAPLAPTARTPMAIGKQNLEEIPVQLSLINI